MPGGDKGDDVKKIFSAGVKSTVELVNSALLNMERGTKDVRKSISSSWNIASEHSTNTVESVSYIYAKRKEFAPHIIGGSAFLGGSVMTLRRGRIAGILGASFFGASAYGLVHDELSFENVPNMIFGNKK